MSNISRKLETLVGARGGGVRLAFCTQELFDKKCTTHSKEIEATLTLWLSFEAREGDWGSRRMVKEFLCTLCFRLVCMFLAEQVPDGWKINKYIDIDSVERIAISLWHGLVCCIENSYFTD